MTTQQKQIVGVAVASLVLGITGLILLGPLASIPAVICGHIAKSRIKQNPNSLTGDGMARAGLILGYIQIGFMALILPGLIAAIAIPSFVKARQNSQKNECINNMRQIDDAKPQDELKAQDELEEATDETTTFNLGTIYVNIAETKGTRVLKIEPYLVLSEGGLDEILTGMAPLLRDKVLAAASTKTIDELEGPQGRANLKREIMTLINTAIKNRMSGAVIDVYFNEFLIQ